MAGETVYADLHIPFESPCPRPFLSSSQCNVPQQRHWHRIALWVAWVGNAIFGVAVLVLGIWVFQLVSKREEALAVPESDGAGSGDPCTPESSICLRDFRSYLVKSLCHLTWTSSAEDPGCRLCPVDWQLHRDKCYWVSRKAGNWSWSREDCASRSAHLLMLHDREDLEVIRNITRKATFFWIGLSIPSAEQSWTWLNGSCLDQTLYQVAGSTVRSSCGAVKGNQLQAEICSAEFPRICQKDAILV